MKASVIIPTFNRAHHLAATLQSLVLLDFATGEFEIIVIENGSTDNTSELVFNFSQQYPKHNIRYFYDDVPGLLTGRHRGAQEASSDILVFIDDDIIADAGWLNAITETFNNMPEVHLVGGKCLPHYEKEPPRWFNYFWNILPDGGKMFTDLSLCDYGNNEKEVHPAWIWGLNFSIRKKTLYELGGFHPDNLPPIFQHYQGDGETGLSFKLFEKGYKAFYNPKATVLHRVPAERMTLAYFDKRYFYQGICNSYTEIRNNKGIVPGMKKIYRKKIRPLGSRLYRMFNVPTEQLYNNLSSNEIAEKEMLTCRFQAFEKAGYEFHQQMARKSSLVLNWILKENYFNYKLPR